MPIILVAEDDKFLASAYKAKLQKSGFDVLIAIDGQEALNQLQKTKPDLILLDLIMPIVDGFVFLTSIKNDPKVNKIPILVASNLGQKEDIDKAMALGADSFVVKSDLSLEELVLKIKSMI